WEGDKAPVRLVVLVDAVLAEPEDVDEERCAVARRRRGRLHLQGVKGLDRLAVADTVRGEVRNVEELPLRSLRRRPGAVAEDAELEPDRDVLGRLLAGRERGGRGRRERLARL